MIWALLWALVAIAFLVFCFRGRWRWFVGSVLGLAAFIAGALVQGALEKHAGYVKTLDILALIGTGILILAVPVLVVDIACMSVYTIRYGRSRDRHGKSIAETASDRDTASGSPLPVGFGLQKILYRRSVGVSMESLVDGTRRAASA